MRTALTTILELVGIGAVVFGCWMIAVPAGVIAAGVALVAIGVTNA